MKIKVSALVRAPLALVWHSYTSSGHIVQWNAASDDWHTTSARVDLRVGGAFSSWPNILFYKPIDLQGGCVAKVLCDQKG